MASHSSTTLYPCAILFALVSLLIALLILPPLVWHARNRNVGAAALIAWLIALNLFSFINAIIWPTDDLSTWFDGTGLCDLEAQIYVASQVALAASFACILRALAKVLHAERSSACTGQTAAQKRRGYAVDLLWCVGFPLVQAVVHLVVQRHRYYIVGIAGCAPTVSDNLLASVLIVSPPTIWVLLDTYYAILIIIRLYHYRRNFSSILASSRTTKSRFIRLYVICILWICCAVPVQSYAVYLVAVHQREPFSWSTVHSTELWDQVMMLESGGRILPDRWVPFGAGIAVFVFFGVGKDAVRMYRAGFERVFPRLMRQERRACFGSVTTSPAASTTRMWHKEKSVVSESTRSDHSAMASTFDSALMKRLTYLDVVKDVDSKNAAACMCEEDNKEVCTPSDKLSVLTRMSSLFSKRSTPRTTSQVLLTSFSSGEATLHCESEIPGVVVSR